MRLKRSWVDKGCIALQALQILIEALAAPADNWFEPEECDAKTGRWMSEAVV
jgi:hypothetical protein